MTSKRLMGIGNSIINYSKRDMSTINTSSLLDRSIKSIRTNSTHETPRKITSSYSLTKKEQVPNDLLSIDSNFLSSINNNSRRSYNNKDLMNYLRTEPNMQLKSTKLISNADKLLKDRRNNHLMMNQLIKSVFMKKTNEICLDNYKIKLLTNKRNEINTKINDISKAIKSTEKIFEKDYKNFLDFVENTNNSYKRQETLMNKFKRMIDEKETEFNKECAKNKKLKVDIENIVRKILTLNFYGSFVHKVFTTDYLYKNIKKSEGQSYLNVAEDIIREYQKHNEQGANDKILDEYWLMAQFNEFEQKIINLLNERESYKKNLMKKELEEKEEIKRLIKNKKDNEKRLELAIEEKNNFMKSLTTYTTPEDMDVVLDCVNELAELFGLNNSPSFSLLMKEKNATNYTSICFNLMKIIKEKENLINNYIDEIEDIVNGENNDDQLLIEEIISERKKQIKKEKISELQQEQKELLRKKNMKAVEKAFEIVIKGRKVVNIPIIKTKKKKKKIIVENDDNEYLNYSSEES